MEADGRIGTDPIRILEVIEQEAASDYIYLYGDLGSGILSIETALDLLVRKTSKTHCINGPLVELLLAFNASSFFKLSKVPQGP